jgi:hypothetical protein
VEHGDLEADDMTAATWISLSERERTLVLDALGALRRASTGDANDIIALTIKLLHVRPHPEITVGVHGGQVQWTLGNPFPIRVCDYDAASDEDLPHVDERGQRCRMWWGPADDEIAGSMRSES